ncbi:MAG: hypothetical protein AB7L09_22210 [Nitrospira sp.]
MSSIRGSAIALSNNGSSVSVTNPSGLSVGDFRIVWLTLTSGPDLNEGTLDEDWEVAFHDFVAPDTTRDHYILTHTVEAGDPSSYTLPFTGSTNYGMIQVALQPDADYYCAIDELAGFGYDTANTGSTSTAPALDPTDEASRVFAFFMKALNSSSVVHSTPSGMTELVDQAGTGSAGNGVALDTEVLSSGSTWGPKTSTSSSGRWCASSLIVRDIPLVVPGQFLPFF